MENILKELVEAELNRQHDENKNPMSIRWLDTDNWPVVKIDGWVDIEALVAVARSHPDDLIQSERIKDLEDINRSLVAQVNKLQHELNRERHPS